MEIKLHFSENCQNKHFCAADLRPYLLCQPALGPENVSGSVIMQLWGSNVFSSMSKVDARALALHE